MSVITETWRALAAPRRAVPMLLVMIPMIVVQVWFDPRPDAVIVALGLCAGFALVGPAAWRTLMPMGAALRWAPLRLLAYAAVVVSVVLFTAGLLPRLLGTPPTFLTDPTSLGIATALFLVGGWGLGRDISLEAAWRRERERSERLAMEAERAQLLALRNHLDPHFLFNTLNAIAEWCREDGEVAERAVLMLSAMLREIMTGIRKPSWPLARELELLDALFELHRVRDPELFVVERELPDPIPAVEIPPLLLLPLAENAMKHGPAAGHRGRVRLRIDFVTDTFSEVGGTSSGTSSEVGGTSSEVGGTSSGPRDGGGTSEGASERAAAIRIRIENPGPFNGPRDGGEGLRTVSTRLRLAWGAAAAFSIDSDPAAPADAPRTVVELLLPRSPPALHT